MKKYLVKKNNEKICKCDDDLTFGSQRWCEAYFWSHLRGDMWFYFENIISHAVTYTKHAKRKA